MSVHQADLPSSAEQLSQLSEYIDQQSRLAIGDDCKVLIFKRISNEFGVAYELSMSTASSESWGFLDNQSLTTSGKTGWQVQDAFKNFQLETILNIGSCCACQCRMSGFRTKPGLVNKIRLPDCGPGVAVAPSYSATTIRVRLSSVPSALQPGQRKPCQSSGEVMKQHFGTDCRTNKAGSSCGGDHGRRRMAYHGMMCG